MLLAQDGSGPSTKIEDGFAAGYLDGAILSIKTRNSDTLAHDVTGFLTNHSDKALFVDTHFYASQIAMTRPGKIPNYALYETGLTRRDFSIRSISNYARRLVDYQRELGLTNILLPSLTIANFDDYTSQISLQLCEASLEYIREIDGSTLKPYITLAVHEAALLDNERLSQYLDDITLLEGVTGFYIVVERANSSMPNWQDSRTLAKLMYVVNTLSDNYDVVCGFTDFPGMLLLGAGANHVASGWHQTLRNYTGAYFLQRGGMNNGKFRYASKELLTQLMSEPDLQSIIRRGLSADFIDSEYGEGLADPDNLVFPPTVKILNQWKAFHGVGQQIITADDPMQKVEDLITIAERNAITLRENGIILDRESVGHYPVWKQAIESFKNGVL